MSSYHDFRRRSLKRRLRQKVLNYLAIGLSVAVFGSMAWYGIVCMDLLSLENRDKFLTSFDLSSASSSQKPNSNQDVADESDPAATPAPTEAAAPEPTATPQPVEITNQTSIAAPNPNNPNWNTMNYDIRVLNTEIKTEEDGSTAMDFRLAGLAENGVIDLSYFDGVTFLGDSITQGYEVYDTEISNVGATFLAYKGVSPKAIVDLATVKRVDGSTEVALDALVESAPSQVYILLGTNTLVSDTDYSSFLAYYEYMIDMIYERLPDVTIYVQSITPVRPEVRHTTPGLYTSRLMKINDELSALALRKGCYFLNLWEVLADENGDYIDEYAAGDGYHMTPAGYQVWIDYLRTHTVYTPTASYEAGTSYKID